MQATVENISQLERRIRISVPRAQIETEVDSRLKRLARTAKVHGFRPGKVPLKIVAQQYGGQVRREVIGETMQRSIADALQEQSVRIAGYPVLEGASEAANGDTFDFSATFEVYPEITLGSVADRSIERPQVQVSEQDVDRTIEILRKQRATYDPVNRASQKGDQVEIDYRGTIDGVAFAGGEAKGQMVALGEGRMLADFEGNLVGLKAGEEKSFPVAFPAEYHGKEVAGKTATFVVRVNRVLAQQLPEVGAEFAKSLGVDDGDVTKMRTEVRSNIEREAAKRVEARVKEQAMEALLDATSVELPKSLVEIERDQMRQRTERDWAARGMRTADVSIPSEMFDEPAKRRVKLGLILGEVVRSNQLHASPEQVRAIVEDFAASYERPEDIVAWYYQEPSRLAEAESLALEQNVVNWVLGVAKVTDKPITFDELMGIAK